MEILETLGLHGDSIIFYLINLAIIVVAMYFLLRKPVGKMIKTQREKLEKITTQNEELLADAEKKEKEYKKLMAEVREESMRISNEALQSANARSEEIISTAQAQADSIINLARADVVAEKERIKNEYNSAVKEMSFEIAEKILERELNEKDNSKIVENCLKGLD